MILKILLYLIIYFVISIEILSDVFTLPLDC